AVSAARGNPARLLCGAAEQKPPDRQLSRAWQLRARNRGAAAYRDAARHLDRTGRARRRVRRAHARRYGEDVPVPRGGRRGGMSVTANIARWLAGAAV